jgi:hypothetical protein
LKLLALGDGARGRRQARQRQVDQARYQARAKQREHAHHAGPADPLDPGQAFEAVALEHQPVFVVVDVKADPEAGRAVHAARKARVGAQALLDDLGDVVHQGIGRRRLDHVVFFERENADAFIAEQLEQQFAAQFGRRVGEGGLGDGDHRNDQFGRLLHLRAALDGADHADPRRHRYRGQDAEQQEGAPEQAAPEPGQARHAGSGRITRKH